MQKVTVSLDDRHIWELKARQRIDDLDSRSAAVRHILDEYETLHTEYANLESEYADLHTRYDAREGDSREQAVGSFGVGVCAVDGHTPRW